MGGACVQLLCVCVCASDLTPALPCALAVRFPGPKVGYEANDNGFLRLDRVSVPRSALFARFARVTKEGVYERVPGSHAKAAFGTMVFVRSMIVVYAARYLARALTIAIRYSAVRRQFPDPSNPSREIPVLNYQTQQQQLFTLLSTAFAFHFTGGMMRKMYEANKANLAGGDSSLMAELHATSSGLKALTTTITSEGQNPQHNECTFAPRGSRGDFAALIFLAMRSFWS